MGLTRNMSMAVNARCQLGAMVNQTPVDLPADYWQENDTENYFIEETTGLVLTLEDL